MPDPKPLVLGDAGSPQESEAVAWGYVSKAGSSLADLATRSAGDLSTGTLSDARLSLAMQRGLAPSAFSPTTVFQVGNNDWTSLVYETSGGTLAYSDAEQGVVFTGAGCWATLRLRMPVDPSATYTARVVFKKLTGTGVVYVGAKSLTNAWGKLATDTSGSYNYFGALGVSVGVGVTRVCEGSISGYNPASPTAGVHTKFDPEAKYWDLVLIANYSGSGTTVVQSIEIIKQPLVPLLLSPSSADRAGLRLPHGVAPTSPVDGDLWSTSAGLYLRLSGTTRAFLHDGSTLDSAKLSGALPALSGAALTALNASNLGSGTVPLARLASIADAQIAAAAAIAWSKIAKSGSSLADLATRSASDLSSGTLANARTTGTAAATPSTLVLRDGAGRAQVADPAADADAATKGYVDAAVEGVDLPPDDLDMEALADLLDLVDPWALAEMGPRVDALTPTVARWSQAWGTIAANTTATASLAIAGVVQGVTPLNATPTAALPAGLVVAWAAPTATGTVTIAIRNTTGAGIAAGTIGFIVQAWLGLS